MSELQQRRKENNNPRQSPQPVGKSPELTIVHDSLALFSLVFSTFLLSCLGSLID